METNELHRGRLIDHVQIVAADFESARRFYRAILEALEIPLSGEQPGFFWADELVVTSTDSPAATGRTTGPTHLAFQARNRDVVERFYQAGLAAGGTDNGAPGLRPYHPEYFAAFLLDPDGNNVEAVYHGAHQRSSPSVKITF